MFLPFKGKAHQATKNENICDGIDTHTITSAGINNFSHKDWYYLVSLSFCIYCNYLLQHGSDLRGRDFEDPSSFTVDISVFSRLMIEVNCLFHKRIALSGDRFIPNFV